MYWFLTAIVHPICIIQLIIDKPFYCLTKCSRRIVDTFSKKCAGQFLCREEMTQFSTAYKQKRFFFSLTPFYKKMTSLYYIIQIPRHYNYHIDYFIWYWFLWYLIHCMIIGIFFPQHAHIWRVPWPRCYTVKSPLHGE